MRILFKNIEKIANLYEKSHICRFAIPFLWLFNSYEISFHAISRYQNRRNAFVFHANLLSRCIHFGVSEILVSCLFLLWFYRLDNNWLSDTYKKLVGFQEEDHDCHWSARISKTDYIYSSIPQARPFHQNDREDWQQSTWWYDGLPCSPISWPWGCRLPESHQ